MRSLLLKNEKKKIYSSSLMTENLLKSHAYSTTKIIILKKIIDNIKAIEETSFSHFYFAVSLYFILFNISKISIFLN